MRAWAAWPVSLNFWVSAPKSTLRLLELASDASTTPLPTGMATPTIDVRRNLWEVPADPNDDPPYIYVIQRLEENPQGGNVNGTAFIEWKACPLSGVILRLGILIFDGGATIPVGNGVVEASLANSNSL